MEGVKSQTIASVVGAVAGAVATAVIGMTQYVEPIKDSVKVLEAENTELKETVDGFRYGKTVDHVRQDDLEFDYLESTLTSGGTLTVKFLVTNLSNETKDKFMLFRKESAVQTDSLDVYTPDEIRVYNSDYSKRNFIRWSIPPKAKNIPIELVINNFEANSNVISMLSATLSQTANASGSFSILFSDLNIRKVD